MNFVGLIYIAKWTEKYFTHFGGIAIRNSKKENCIYIIYVTLQRDIINYTDKKKYQDHIYIEG